VTRSQCVRSPGGAGLEENPPSLCYDDVLKEPTVSQQRMEAVVPFPFKIEPRLSWVVVGVIT
jgi:hypothetical protein